MSWWVPPAATGPDELVLFEALANNFIGGRAIGGRVTITDERLLFTPNRIDGLTGGRPLAVERRDISRVSVEEPGRAAARRHGFVALMRRLVRIEHPAGPIVLLVNRPRVLVDVLREGDR
jgi:hypothetical protein